MKQNITIDQLKELNNNQLQKLYEYTQCPYIMRMAYEKEYEFKVTEFDYVESAHDINIGKMIEILDKYDSEFIQSIFKIPNNEWSCCTMNDYEGYMRSHTELCDELWYIVKNIIQ